MGCAGCSSGVTELPTERTQVYRTYTWVAVVEELDIVQDVPTSQAGGPGVPF